MGLKDLFKKKEIVKKEPLRNGYFWSSDFLQSSPNFLGINGNDTYLQWYFQTPQLRSIVDYKVNSYLNGKLTLLDGEDVVETDPLLDLFESPNPFMSGLEFWETIYKHLEIFEIAYIYKLVPTGFKNTSKNVKRLFPLPANVVSPKVKYGAKLTSISDLKEFVEHYDVSIGGVTYQIAPENMWVIQKSSLRLDNENILTPNNRLDSCRWAISNIQVANEAKNVILTKRGALGIFSNGAKNEMSQTLGFDSEDEAKFQEKLRQHGLLHSKDQFMLTNLSLDYNQINLPIKNLELNDGLDYEQKVIADVFNFDLLLLNQIKGSTFSNKKEAQKGFYQNVIIPGTNLLAESIKKEFKTEYAIKFDFSQLPILQEDKLKLTQQRNLQTQTILNVNQQVASGVIDTETAINILVSILQINADTASDLITTNTNQNENRNTNTESQRE
jgi:hypothetical protein